MISSKRRYFLYRVAVVLLFLALIVVARLFSLDEYLTLDNLKMSQDLLSQIVEDHYLLSVFVYIVLYTIVTGLALPGAAVLTLGSGLLFGTVPGSIYVVVAATLGATISFLLSRYLIRDFVVKRHGERLKTFNSEIDRNGYRYLLALRLIPLFPFFLINLLAGLTSISLRTYVVTTAIGIIPGTLIYANAGSQLATVESVSDIFSGRIIMALILVALVMLLPIAFQSVRGAMSKRG